MDPITLIVSIFSGIVLGAAGSFIMEAKGRNPIIGFLFGLLLGPIGLLIVLVLENRYADSRSDQQNLATVRSLSNSYV
jgi:uncharacterized membrane protein YeaQ/YmgE (transglycosylase-associated protein family)